MKRRRRPAPAPALPRPLFILIFLNSFYVFSLFLQGDYHVGQRKFLFHRMFFFLFVTGFYCHKKKKKLHEYLYGEYIYFFMGMFLSVGVSLFTMGIFFSFSIEETPTFSGRR